MARHLQTSRHCEESCLFEFRLQQDTVGRNGERKARRGKEGVCVSQKFEPLIFQMSCVVSLITLFVDMMKTSIITYTYTCIPTQQHLHPWILLLFPPLPTRHHHLKHKQQPPPPRPLTSDAIPSSSLSSSSPYFKRSTSRSTARHFCSSSILSSCPK
jgi:hypothetical protein